jgi:hypothetical protein
MIREENPSVSLAPATLYKSSRKCLYILLDLRHPDAEEHLRSAEAAWCGYADVVNLTAEASVLIIRPGGATRLVA